MGAKREGYSQEDGWEMGGNRPKPNSIMYQGLFQQNLPERDLTTPPLPPTTLQASKALAKILLPEESPSFVTVTASHLLFPQPSVHRECHGRNDANSWKDVQQGQPIAVPLGDYGLR